MRTVIVTRDSLRRMSVMRLSDILLTSKMYILIHYCIIQKIAIFFIIHNTLCFKYYECI